MKTIALIAAVGLVLAGCGGSHASSSAPRPHHRPHYPVVVHPPLVFAITRTRVTPRGYVRKLPAFVSRTRLGIYTWGSGSCPSVPDKLTVLGPHTIRIHLHLGTYESGKLVPGPTGVCTADRTTTPMLVAINPSQIDVHRPLTVLGVSSRGITVAPLKS